MRLCRCTTTYTVRPKRGHACSHCRLYIVGPPRSTDTAHKLAQKVHYSKSRRPLKGILGSKSAGLEEQAERAVRRRVRADRNRSAVDDSPAMTRVVTGQQMLDRLIRRGQRVANKRAKERAAA